MQTHHITPNWKRIESPKNQYGLVLFTLIFPPKELSMGWFMKHCSTHKLSTRIGEMEREHNVTLVSRSLKKYTNKFGHCSDYTVYKRVIDMDSLVDLYIKYNK